MKTIGLVGGMSWESSIEYYRIINEAVRDRLGGLHSAKSVMCSVDFSDMEELQHPGRWAEAAQLMVATARHVEDGGADFVVICCNTMHKVADEVQQRIDIPLLHIADATAERIKAQGLGRIGLLGTKFTMEEDLYKGRLTERHGLEVVIPVEREREFVHRVIYDELVRGEVKPSSKRRTVEIMDKLVGNGAEGIILGCTELGLLVGEDDTQVSVFDTTPIHATVAVEYALGDWRPARALRSSMGDGG